jgi:hypothetical protein
MNQTSFITWKFAFYQITFFFQVHARGAVIQVKVLGTMCLVDEGDFIFK